MHGAGLIMPAVYDKAVRWAPVGNRMIVSTTPIGRVMITVVGGSGPGWDYCRQLVEVLLLSRPRSSP